jgi:hypothetical protein
MPNQAHEFVPTSGKPWKTMENQAVARLNRVYNRVNYSSTSKLVA